MVNSIHRLGFSPTATLEHRKLAVELAEVIIKWELFGIKEDMDSTTADVSLHYKSTRFIKQCVEVKSSSSFM